MDTPQWAIGLAAVIGAAASFALALVGRLLAYRKELAAIRKEERLANAIDALRNDLAEARVQGARKDAIVHEQTEAIERLAAEVRRLKSGMYPRVEVKDER